MHVCIVYYNYHIRYYYVLLSSCTEKRGEQLIASSTHEGKHNILLHYVAGKAAGDGAFGHHSTRIVLHSTCNKGMRYI